MSLLANSNAIESGGYPIANSLRFRSSASAYLNRTPASAGNRTTWTYSAWLKIGKIPTVLEGLLSADTVSNNTVFLNTNSGLTWDFNGSTALVTSQVFRDYSAHYHFLFVADTGNTTSTDRLRMYVNGVRINAFSTASYPAQNTQGGINSTTLHAIARSAYDSSRIFDGYLSEVNFIDGQALTPSYFGETNTDGVWVPKKYSGTYGTNGFYLPFSNGSSTATLCYDQSGNGNNWTPNNISLTAGSTYDWMVDTPTNNYAVLNPLDKGTSVNSSNGNLDFSVPTAASYGGIRGSFAISQKSYWEVTNTCGALPLFIGILNSSVNVLGAADLYSVSGQATYRSSNGNKNINGTETAYGVSNTTNDVIGVAYDPDNGELTFYKNGTSQGTISTGFSGYTYFPAAYDSTSSATSAVFNFGQRPFTYTPPTGFKALCTANLPAAVIKNGGKHFAATTWAGNSGSQSVVNSGGFQPDFVWIKNRSNAYSHILQDAVRGVGKTLQSNATTAEQANGVLTSFDSSGFSLNNGTGDNVGNLVGWQWKANGTGVTNTAGSITSTVSANTTAGFSVVTYTGSGVAGTIGHGLGVAPKLIIVKARSGTGDWSVYTATTGAGNYVLLNTTAASTTSSTKWNNTSPTSSVFSVGLDTTTNMATVTYVAYCFAEIAGYSKFGSYTGNGSSDGPFVYCGFRPKYVLIKASSAAGTWTVWDAARSTSNSTNLTLAPNNSNAESSVINIDILSNGFKVRHVGDINVSGVTSIYAAFAENPYGGNNVSPVTAR